MKLFGQLKKALLELVVGTPSDSEEGRVWYDTTPNVVAYEDDVGTTALVSTTRAQNITGVKTMTSPVLSSPSITTPSKLDVKQDTAANLATYAATASNGQLCFATDDKKMYQVVDSALVAVGGGGTSEYAVFGTLDADNTDYTDFDTTALTNATFGEESTNELRGTKSYLLTNVTGSVNEKLESPDQTLNLQNKSKEIAVTFNYTYDGAADDIRAYLYDVTNSAELGTVKLEAASTSKEVSLSGYALSTTAVVTLKFEILVVNNGKKLIFDGITFTDDPFVYKKLINVPKQEAALSVSGTNWTTT
ncbi:MAG: hypothetical protein U9O94_02705, partial [Nanoarchaeota archaeon]|nr:hypothetical protein [Nanoarchaeota archaeon]